MMRTVAVGLSLLFVVALAAADEPQTQRPIAARIDGEPVEWIAADLELKRAYGDREFSEEERSRLRKAALEQVIDRRLVLRYLERTNQAASSQDVDFALAQFEKDLQSREKTLEEHCREVGLQVEDIRRVLLWQLSWERYLGTMQTDDNLQKYFERYRREFDGTELRVAQILFKVAEGDAAALTEAKARADELRKKIVAGEITFADAARQHSEAPSADRGGDIGWIERRRPMPEGFSSAAYALKPGAVSEPIESPFGIHLITVLEAKPGQKSWRDVAEELRPAVALYLFRWIADRERKVAKIERLE